MTDDLNEEIAHDHLAENLAAAAQSICLMQQHSGQNGLQATLVPPPLDGEVIALLDTAAEALSDPKPMYSRRRLVYPLDIGDGEAVGEPATVGVPGYGRQTDMQKLNIDLDDSDSSKDRVSLGPMPDVVPEGMTDMLSNQQIAAKLTRLSNTCHKIDEVSGDGSPVTGAAEFLDMVAGAILRFVPDGTRVAAVIVNEDDA